MGMGGQCQLSYHIGTLSNTHTHTITNHYKRIPGRRCPKSIGYLLRMTLLEGFRDPSMMDTPRELQGSVARHWQNRGRRLPRNRRALVGARIES